MALSNPVRAFWLDNRVLLTVALSYIAVGGGFLTATGRPWPIRLIVPWFTVVWLSLCTLYLAWQWTQHPKRLRAAIEPSRLFGALIIPFLIVPFQTTFQALKLSIGHFLGFPWDRAFTQLDHTIHGGPAWRWFAVALDYPPLMHGGLIAYQGIWAPLAAVLVFWLAWHPDRVFRARALVTVALLWIIAGTFFAALFASAGPCFVQETDFQPLIARLDGIGSEVRVLQQNLWQLQVEQRWHFAAGVSAFPSMHVAISVWMVIITWQRSRTVGLLFALYAIFTQIWAVLLGWHYAIDGYASLFIAWACWSLAGRLTKQSAEATVVRTVADGDLRQEQIA